MSIRFDFSDGLEPEEDLFTQEIERRGPRFGQQTMQAILEHQATDRVSSKKAQRIVRVQKGSPST